MHSIASAVNDLIEYFQAKQEDEDFEVRKYNCEQEFLRNSALFYKIKPRDYVRIKFVNYQCITPQYHIRIVKEKYLYLLYVDGEIYQTLTTIKHAILAANIYVIQNIL